MDRRNFVKTATAAVAATLVTPGARATPVVDKMNTRKVFKIVVHQEITHIQVGSDGDLLTYVEAFREGGADTVIATHNDVKINVLQRGGAMLVPSKFADLKKGDVFVLYEETGEVVGEDGKRVMVCQDPAFLSDSGVWCVQAEPAATQTWVPAMLKE